MLGYSWTSHNPHRRMDYQKSDWEGRGGGGGKEGGMEGGGGWGNEGSKRCMNVLTIFN